MEGHPLITTHASMCPAQHAHCYGYVLLLLLVIIITIIVVVIQLDTYYVQLETKNYIWRIVFIRLACGHVCGNVMWDNLLD